MAVKKLDLCKINTARLRTLRTSQLRRVANAVGRTSSTDESSRGLVGNFIYYLKSQRGILHKKIGTSKSAGLAAKRLEHKIWAAQAKAGCKISPTELVARDAEMEGRYGVANRLRRPKKRKPSRAQDTRAAKHAASSPTPTWANSYQTSAGAKLRRSPLKGKK